MNKILHGRLMEITYGIIFASNDLPGMKLAMVVCHRSALALYKVMCKARSCS